mgnify:CR=1 FL=1
MRAAAANCSVTNFAQRSIRRSPLVAPGPFWQAEFKGSSMIPAKRANVSVGPRVTATGDGYNPASLRFLALDLTMHMNERHERFISCPFDAFSDRALPC